MYKNFKSAKYIKNIKLKNNLNYILIYINIKFGILFISLQKKAKLWRF